MKTDIKKKLARNWFKILQDMICFDIEEIENSQKTGSFDSDNITDESKEKIQTSVNQVFNAVQNAN